MWRPTTATTQYPFPVYPLSLPPCFCGLQEGLNSESCLPTTPISSQVKTLQGQDPSQFLRPSNSLLSKEYLYMTHLQLYAAFMSVIQDEVSIFTIPNKYGSQSWLIKYLITHFESAEQDGISNNHKNLVKNINQHHILQWECYHIRVKIGHQSYTKWELQSACISMILLKTTHQVIFREYGVLKSWSTEDLSTTPK